MDTFFNHDVADWLYNSVSKMDDAEAEMFTLFTVYEVHKQDIENNRRTLDRHIEEVQKSILADLHPEIREMVAKAFDPDTPYEEKYGKPQPRGKGGRWSKLNISVERGKGSVATRPVNYREDKIRANGFDLSNALTTAEKEGTAFSDRWTSRGPNDASTNERTYRRVQAGAQLLGNVPNKNVQAAAALGEFAGKMGPEAEKVFGPAARRTAYRYRGTERMPDAELSKVRNEAMLTERKRLYSDEDFKTGAAKPLNAEQRMAASEAAAANYLYTRLPKKGLSSLQRASGKLPPSEGVIISADGEIVTQAVGYNEDHYLPFNLKNLKGLKGGAYVRTRSTGGLTSEDIYTGLIAGARSVTVVSRSGVFTLDFEDDLRGGRRYSDKARQMVGRYAQTLDAVQSEKVARRGLTPDERAEIREEIEGQMEGMGYKTAEIEQRIKEREQEYSKTPQLTKSELDEVNRQAMEAVVSGKGPRTEGSERFVPKDPKKAFLAYKSEFMDAALENKQQRMYQLDAEGYEAAMEALHEQFPYFVARTKVHKIPRGNEKDSGYVRPNYNRPKAVQAGFFDEDINGRGKFNASDLHYQNHGVRSARAAAEGEESAEEGVKKPKKASFAEVKAGVQVKERRRAAAKELADVASQVAKGQDDAEKDYPMLMRYAKTQDLNAFSEAEIEKMMTDIEKIESLITHNKDKIPGEHARFTEAMATYKRADTQLKSRVVFERKDWNPDVVSAIPQKMGDDAEHSPGHPMTLYSKAAARVMQNAGLVNDVAADADDAALRVAQKQYSDVYSAAKNLQADVKDVTKQIRLEEAMIRAGYDERKVEGLEQILEEKGATGLNNLVEEMEKKALGVMQLRSIRVASEGAEEAKEADTTVLQGELVKPGRFNIEQVKNVMQQEKTPDDVKFKLAQLVKAWDTDDEVEIMEAAQKLPKEYGTMVQHIIEELNRRAQDD